MLAIGIILIIIGLFSCVVARFAAEENMTIVFYPSLILFIIGVVGGLFLIHESRSPDTPEQVLEMKLKAFEDAQKDLQKFYIDHPEFKNEN